MWTIYDAEDAREIIRIIPDAKRAVRDKHGNLIIECFRHERVTMNMEDNANEYRHISVRGWAKTKPVYVLVRPSLLPSVEKCTDVLLDEIINAVNETYNSIEQSLTDFLNAFYTTDEIENADDSDEDETGDFTYPFLPVI